MPDGVTTSLNATVTNWIKIVRDREALVSNLLFHLLDLLHRAASLVFVLHSNAKDWISPAYLLLLLLLSLLQLALGADALRVVHVVGLHHLETNKNVNKLKRKCLSLFPFLFKLAKGNILKLLLEKKEWSIWSVSVRSKVRIIHLHSRGRPFITHN